MKPRMFFVIIAAFVALWAMLGASAAVAQKPATTPPPLTRLTNVEQDVDGFTSAWCGKDWINYRVEYSYGAGMVETVWMKVQWFHNDPSAKISRSFGYAAYDKDGNLKASAVTPFGGAGESPMPATFLEEPAGFWRTYVHRTGVSFGATDPGGNPLVVMFFFRNREAVCPLRKTFWFGGKGGGKG